MAEAWQGIVQAFMPETDAPKEVAAEMARKVAAVGLVDLLKQILPFIGAWLQEFAAMTDAEEEEMLERLKVLVGLLGDVASVVGKPAMGQLGFKLSSPQLRAVIDLEDKLEIASWGSELVDSDGARKKTLASWARDNLPLK